MTLILGMYYDNQKGALIASDSKVTIEETTYALSQKIDMVEGVVLSTVGDAYLGDELAENISPLIRKIPQGANRSREIRARIKEQMEELAKYHKISKEDKSKDLGLLGFYTDKPEFFFFSHVGDSTFVRWNFYTIGEPSDGTLELLKNLYSPDYSKEQAINLAVYAIVHAATSYIGIDDNPQIALIDKDGTRILNLHGDNYLFQTPEIKQAKTKAHEIIALQKKMFDVLSRDDDSRSKLIRMLGEF